MTGDSGRFSCASGEAVTFKLRNLTLGQAACGDKIFLDDIATGDKRNNIAAVLQNLSTTAASSGLIDLSAIPADLDVATPVGDLTDSNPVTVESRIDAARTAVTTAAGVTLTPEVSVANAAAHANNNLPAVDGALASILDGYDATSPTILGTRTSGNSEDCWNYYTADVEIVKVGSGYTASLRGIVGWDELPTAGAVCNDMTGDLCSSEDFLAGNNKVIRGNTASFGSKEEATVSLTTEDITVDSILYPAGSVKVDVNVILGGFEDFAEYSSFAIDTNNDGIDDQEVSLQNINNYFPFTTTTSTNLTLTFGTDNSISGSFVDDSFSLSMSDYQASDSYVLTRTQDKCTYSISKR